jgi:hypothetical protein
LPAANQVADGADGLGQRRIVEIAMQIIDVDVVGREPAQAVIARLHDPAARESAIMRRLGHHVAHLGRHDPPLAMRGDGRTGDGLGDAVRVNVGGIDEIDSRIERGVDDPLRGCSVGPVAEHHRPQTKHRYLEVAAAEFPVLHRHVRAPSREMELRKWGHVHFYEERIL